jgi:hypothetical protein
MKKFVAGILAGVAVLALTLIALLLDPTTFLQPHWKKTSIAIAIFAIVCMALQGIWTKTDEDAEKRRGKAEADARDRQAQQLFDMLDKILLAVVNQERRTPTSHSYIAASNAMLILNGLRESSPGSDEIPALWRTPRRGSTGPVPKERASDSIPTPTVSRKEAFDELNRRVMEALNISQRTE